MEKPGDGAEPRFVQPDEVEHVRRALAGVAGREPAQLAEGGDDVGRGLVEREALVLRHVAELAAHADRIVGHVDPAHLEAPLGGVAQPEHHPEEGRLPGAVGPDEADAPGRDVEIEPLDGRDTGVALGESPRPEEGGGGVHEASLSGRDVAFATMRL